MTKVFNIDKIISISVIVHNLGPTKLYSNTDVQLQRGMCNSLDKSNVTNLFFFFLSFFLFFRFFSLFLFILLIIFFFFFFFFFLLLLLLSATTYVRFSLVQPLSSNYIYSVLISSNCVRLCSLYLPKSSFHRVLGLPIDLLDKGFHLLIFCKVVSSGMRSKWPNQINHCFFNKPNYILSF